MKIVMVILSVIFTLHLSAAIIHIPSDQPTIQAGIDVSVDTDTVLVTPGTYTENINFSGKNILVTSWYITASDSNHINQTIIDDNQIDRVVTFENGDHDNGNQVASGVYFYKLRAGEFEKSKRMVLLK